MSHVAESGDDGDQLVAVLRNTPEIFQEAAGGFSDGSVLIARRNTGGRGRFGEFTRTASQDYHFTNEADEIVNVAAAQPAQGFLAPEFRFSPVPQLAGSLIEVLIGIAAQQFAEFLDGVTLCGSRQAPTKDVLDKLEFRLNLRVQIDQPQVVQDELPILDVDLLIDVILGKRHRTFG